ncbi:MAG: PD40 domain-containing protein [Bacteroidetes bacterium]|nr:PD40 domain-containing protein [Bacteroidota bacterium]
MRLIHNRTLSLMLALFCLAACSKKNDGNPNGGGNNGNNGGNGNTSIGSGTIYVDWATEGLLKIDLSTGQRSTVIQNMIPVRSVDITKDGQKMLTCTDAPGTDYDANLVTISNIKDATIITQFKYYATDGDFAYPNLSPDASMIGIPPTYSDGIVILDNKGKTLKNLVSFNGRKFGGTLVWMPDNTILFSTTDGLFRSNSAFTQGSLVKQFNFTSWGDVAASPDGTRIALKGGNHIWMMNADGSNLVQVTSSTAEEAYPVFSPDSKYLLVGTNYNITNQLGHWWYLKIIPADGKQYNVDDNADKSVIPVIIKGDKQAGSGTMLWR